MQLVNIRLIPLNSLETNREKRIIILGKEFEGVKGSESSFKDVAFELRVSECREGHDLEESLCITRLFQFPSQPGKKI